MSRPYKYTYKEYKEKFKNLQNKIDIAKDQELISLKNEMDISILFCKFLNFSLYSL